MKSFWTPPVLGMVAGLVLLLGSAAGWVDIVEERDVGGLTVSEPQSVSGTTYAPVAVAIGLGVVVAGALLAVVRGRARRVLGALLTGIGVGALATVGLGLANASAAGGTVTATPFFALAAGAVVLVAGIAAVRGPTRPPAASRYRVEGEQSVDDEWTLAVEDETQD